MLLGVVMTRDAVQYDVLARWRRRVAWSCLHFAAEIVVRE
jgi:hypothetical protein